MEKINSANWDQVFGTSTHQVMFASPRYTDMHFSFEEKGLASGFVRSLSTPGMQLTEVNLRSERPFQLSDPNAQEAAESVFLLDGNAESHFHNLSSPLLLDQNHHNFQYNKHFGGEHIINSRRFHALTITYDLHFLQQLLQQDDDPGTGQLANCLHGKKAFVATPRALPFQGRVTEVIGSIRNCPFTGITRYLFLESKMMELFVLQMEQVRLAEGQGDQYWSRADREKLLALKNYIENNYLESFSLKELGYQFNLNEFKLKKGYRQLFQTTVFGHVHQLRMQKAKNVLESGTMNVSEAAFFVGYENVSSFCTEFKKRFGYSPGKLACAR